MPVLSVVSSGTSADILDAVSSLRTTGVTPTVAALFAHATKNNIFTQLNQPTLSNLCASLTTTLKHPDTSPESRSLALRIVVHIARSVPPANLQPQWQQLALVLLVCLRAAPSSSTRTKTLTSIAALLAAVQPYASLPAVRHSSARLVRALIQPVFSILRSSAPVPVLGPEPVDNENARKPHSKNFPQELELSSSLLVLQAALMVAPRELRAASSDLTNILCGLLSHNTTEIIRKVANVLALLPRVHPPPNRAEVTANLLTRLCGALQDAPALLAHYSPPNTTPENVKRSIPPPPQTVNTLPEHIIIMRHLGLCEAVASLLRTRVGPPGPLPLAIVLRTLTNLIYPIPIDNYAKPPPMARLDAPAAARVAASFPAPAVRTLLTLLRLPDRAALVALSSPFVRALGRRLSALQTSENNPELTTLLLSLLTAAVRAFGVAVFSSDVLSLVISILQVHKTKRDTLVKQSNVQDSQGHRPRKRRRGETTGGDSSTVDIMEQLRDLPSRSTNGNQKRINEAALAVVEAVLSSRAPIPDKLLPTIAKFHDVLNERLTSTVAPSAKLLQASAAAAAAGVSNPSGAFASPLFQKLVSSQSTLQANQQGQSVRALIDAIAHPRGPPIAMHTQELAGTALNQEKMKSPKPIAWENMGTQQDKTSGDNKTPGQETTGESRPTDPGGYKELSRHPDVESADSGKKRNSTECNETSRLNKVNESREDNTGTAASDLKAMEIEVSVDTSVEPQDQRPLTITKEMEEPETSKHDEKEKNGSAGENEETVEQLPTMVTEMPNYALKNEKLENIDAVHQRQIEQPESLALKATNTPVAGNDVNTNIEGEVVIDGNLVKAPSDNENTDDELIFTFEGDAGMSDAPEVHQQDVETDEAPNDEAGPTMKRTENDEPEKESNAGEPLKDPEHHGSDHDDEQELIDSLVFEAPKEKVNDELGAHGSVGEKQETLAEVDITMNRDHGTTSTEKEAETESAVVASAIHSTTESTNESVERLAHIETSVQADVSLTKVESGKYLQIKTAVQSNASSVEDEVEKPVATAPTTQQQMQSVKEREGNLDTELTMQSTALSARGVDGKPVSPSKTQ